MMHLFVVGTWLSLAFSALAWEAPVVSYASSYSQSCMNIWGEVRCSQNAHHPYILPPRGQDTEGNPMEGLAPLGDYLAKQVVPTTRMACAIMTTGETKCWGSKRYSQMWGYGFGPETNVPKGNAMPSVNLGTGRRAVKLAAAYETVCAILDNAEVKCWGKCAEGSCGRESSSKPIIGSSLSQMGDNLKPVKLGTNRKVLDLEASEDCNFCALLDDGNWKCWGRNHGAFMQEDRGYKPNTMGDNLAPMDFGGGKYESKALKVSMSYQFMCAVRVNGEAVCANEKPGEQRSGEPACHPLAQGNGDQGNSWDVPGIDLGTGRTAVDIKAMNWDKVAIVLDNDDIKTFGNNRFMQLLTGANNQIIGDQKHELGDARPRVLHFGPDISVRLCDVMKGHNFMCAIRSDNSIWMWGGHIEHPRTGIRIALPSPPTSITITATTTTETVTTKTSTTTSTTITTTSTQLVWVSRAPTLMTFSLVTAFPLMALLST